MMPILDQIIDDWRIIKSEPLIAFYWIFGILITIVGGSILNATPSNPQFGFPFLAIGFAFAVFGTNIYSNNKSRRKIYEILRKLEAIEKSIQELKNKDCQENLNFNLINIGTNPQIELKKQLNRIEEKLENVALTKEESSKSSTRGELIIGVLLGLWSGIIGAISISSLFELLKLNKESINPVILVLTFFVPIIFLIWFTWKCWKIFLEPISNSG
jgi:tetrahydromethanopterin S-methyltransferase subunit G